MQFLKDITDGAHLITGLGKDYVRIGEVEFANSLIVCASSITDPWPVTNVQQLSSDHWQPVLDTKPELIILGTGGKLIFPEPAQMQVPIDQQIGVEIMDTEAACRTYNLLVHEGRKVTAALIYGEIDS